MGLGAPLRYLGEHLTARNVLHPYPTMIPDPARTSENHSCPDPIRARVGQPARAVARRTPRGDRVIPGRRANTPGGTHGPGVGTPIPGAVRVAVARRGRCFGA